MMKRLIPWRPTRSIALRSGLKRAAVFLVALSTAGPQKCGDGSGGINLFSVKKDIELGEQVKKQIRSSPEQLPILDRKDYAEVYAYIEAMKDTILADDDVIFRDRFDWQIDIVRNDSMLNAFAAPGGYIVLFTGLMHYLDRPSELAGVLGHEIAHADRRHVTDQLTKTYGVALMLTIATGGNPGVLSEMATGLMSLKFSRGSESEADEYSVRYLCGTQYDPAGAAGFFEKIQQESNADERPPQFASTHPAPDNRVESIHQQRKELGCEASVPDGLQAGYERIKALLPGGSASSKP